MIEGIRNDALRAGIVDQTIFDTGIRDLYRTTEADGVFCYTFFKAVAAKTWDNDSLLSIWRAIPPRAAANLAVEAAEEIDRELEAVSSELIIKIESLGERFRLYRSIHRKLHVDQIVKLLNSRSRT